MCRIKLKWCLLRIDVRVAIQPKQRFKIDPILAAVIFMTFSKVFQQSSRTDVLKAVNFFFKREF